MSTPPDIEVQRVLLVEDNPLDQARLARTLERLFPGVEVVTAGTVADAAHHLRTGRFDVAMVDWQLPDGFGKEVLDAAEGCDPLVPVVMMTGGDASDAEGMLSEGAQDFVSKRLKKGELPQQLLRAVKHTVSRARSGKDKQRKALLSETRERNEAMSRLAAGIAHDLNNTLAVVSMNLELLSTLTGPLPGDAAECLDAAREGARAAAERVAQLRTYTGSVEVKSFPVDVNDVIVGALPTVGVGAQTDRARLGGKPATVRGDVAVLHTVFQRLLEGIVELGAPQPPVLAAERPHLPFNARWVLNDEVSVDRELRISLPWQGRSVSALELRRRFDPYREGAHGASLDLGECVGFLRAHSGALAVQSTPGGGSFEVWLPRWSPGVARAAAPTARRAEGATRVWVVDDEPLVLRVLVRLLRLRGMEVEAFADGHDAYMAALDGRTCDLLVTDLLMPGMGGAELVERLRLDGWTQPVIVVTGYSDQVGSLAADGVRVLLKPFANTELFEAIDAMIEAGR